MDKKISLAVGVLKSALKVDPFYKNDIIRDAIRILDPDEYNRMEKEFIDLLDEIYPRKYSQ